MGILYKEIDDIMEQAIVEQYGDWVREYRCLVRGEGCYSIAAVDGEWVVGFAAMRPSAWIAPLDQYFDGFIEVIEVAEAYRRRGIGSTIVKFLEDYARSYGYHQIRAWSSNDKVESLNMWRKLNYCMCPAAMLGPSVKKGYENHQIVGYYYAKRLNT